MDYDGIHYYESTRDNLHLILFSTIGGLSDKKKNYGYGFYLQQQCFELSYISSIEGKTIWTCIRSNDSPNFFALESNTLGKKKKGDRLEELREYVV